MNQSPSVRVSAVRNITNSSWKSGPPQISKKTEQIVQNKESDQLVSTNQEKKSMAAGMISLSVSSASTNTESVRASNSDLQTYLKELLKVGSNNKNAFTYAPKVADSITDPGLQGVCNSVSHLTSNYSSYLFYKTLSLSYYYSSSSSFRLPLLHTFSYAFSFHFLPSVSYTLL